MKRFYESVLPYVFWAKGDVIRAKKSFHHLIEASEKGMTMFENIWLNIGFFKNIMIEDE